MNSTRNIQSFCRVGLFLILTAASQAWCITITRTSDSVLCCDLDNGNHCAYAGYAISNNISGR